MVLLSVIKDWHTGPYHRLGIVRHKVNMVLYLALAVIIDHMDSDEHITLSANPDVITIT